MKKPVLSAVFAVCAAAAFAQEANLPDSDVNLDNPDDAVVETAIAKKQYAQWPAFFAIGEYPSTPDLVGLRITIPYSSKQENVTGIDLGLWGRAQYFEGLQLNILRNDVKDRGAAFQVGLYNSIGIADLFAVQAGLWNESGALRGVQAGLVNLAGEMSGVQVGLINRTEEMYGFQVGLVNIIRDAELQFCPIVNVGF